MRDYEPRVKFVLLVATPLFLFLFLLAAVCLLAAGCAAPLVVAKPLEVHAAVEPALRPCLSSIPKEAKILIVAEPERFAYVDHEGADPKAGIRITADMQSVNAFFGYVTALQAAVRDALGCVTR